MLTVPCKCLALGQRSGWSELWLCEQAELARSYAAMLQSSCTAAAICTSFPKAIMDVHCLIVESGGSDLAVSICAASVALADAGIEMRDLVAACTVVRLSAP